MVSDKDSQRPRLERIREDKDRVEFLRAKVINEVVRQSTACFLDNEAAMLDGQFDVPLLQEVPIADRLDALVDHARARIYCAPEVVSIQAAGFQVVNDLLERFVRVVDDVADKGQRASPHSQMLLRLIPEQFIGPGRVPTQNAYQRLLLLTDFVAGMSDSYAVSLYKKVTGISLPGG